MEGYGSPCATLTPALSRLGREREQPYPPPALPFCTMRLPLPGAGRGLG